MIALGADHGGYRLKEAVKRYLEEKQIPYRDFGTDSEESIDYGPVAEQVARFVAEGKAQRGILCCGTGIGISIAANKVPGIRAAVVTNDFCAEMTRRHNDANILCMGGRVIDEETAVRLTEIFLTTPFEGGRHTRRVAYIHKIEEEAVDFAAPKEEAAAGIALGADHGGYRLKEAVKRYLEEKQIPYRDFGANSEESVDYAPIAEQVARFVAEGKAQRGILCCGTGIGISIAANKVPGIRAAVVTNDFCAEMTRRHNDANILCMGGRVIDEETAVRLTEIFLTTPFEGGRHARRVEYIRQIESKGL